MRLGTYDVLSSGYKRDATHGVFLLNFYDNKTRTITINGAGVENIGNVDKTKFIVTNYAGRSTIITMDSTLIGYIGNKFFDFNITVSV